MTRCSGPRLFVAALAQGRSVIRGTSALMQRRKPVAFGIFALALLSGFLLRPYDPGLLVALHFWSPAHEKTANRLAYFLGTWGDFPTYNIPLALLIWGYGVWRKSPTWRRVALVCFLGAAWAGLADDGLRFTVGRPRPDSHHVDGAYGPLFALHGGYQSFPSGHAASVMGAATALLAVEWPLGMAATLFGLAVMWGRLELNRHYPSDVVVGALIGIYFGAMTGLGSKEPRTIRPTSLDSPAGRD